MKRIIFPVRVIHPRSPRSVFSTWASPLPLTWITSPRLPIFSQPPCKSVLSLAVLRMCYFSFSRLASILLNEGYPVYPLAVFLHLFSCEIERFSWNVILLIQPWLPIPLERKQQLKESSYRFFFFLISGNVSDPKDVLKWWLQSHYTSTTQTLRAEGSIGALEKSCGFVTTRPLGQLTLWALTLGGRCLSRVPALYLPGIEMRKPRNQSTWRDPESWRQLGAGIWKSPYIPLTSKPLTWRGPSFLPPSHSPYHHSRHSVDKAVKFIHHSIYLWIFVANI